MAQQKADSRGGARPSRRFCGDFSPEAAEWLERRAAALNLRVSDLLREAVEKLRTDDPVATAQQIAYAERIARDLADPFPQILRGSKSKCSAWIREREARHKAFRAARTAAPTARTQTRAGNS